MPSRYRTLLRERHRLVITLHAIQSSMTFFSSSSAACRVGIGRGITTRWLQRDISGNLDRLKLPCLVPLDLLLRRQPHSKVRIKPCTDEAISRVTLSIAETERHSQAASAPSAIVPMEMAPTHDMPLKAQTFGRSRASWDTKIHNTSRTVT